MVVLQETKKDKMVPLLVRSTVGRELSSWLDIPACGTSGGVLHAWDPLVVNKVDELVGSFSISVRFVKFETGFKWMFTGVYGHSSPYTP